jgi:GntR family transcriptional regulator, histidine utilization repressor
VPETNQDRTESPWPLYQQVKQLIVRRIQAGHWQPGNKIPTESDLVKTLGMSRMTINRAIRELSNDGHLIRKQGSGTFVAPRKPRMGLLEIRSIADEIKEQGGNHKCNVHLLTRESVTEELAKKTGFGLGTMVYHSITVHRNGSSPIQMADRFVNPDLAPEYLNQDFTAITPSEYLLSVTPLTEANIVIDAISPDKQTCDLLEISKQEPCLLICRTTWSKKILATSSRFISPSSRYSIAGSFKPSSTSQQILA